MTLLHSAAHFGGVHNTHVLPGCGDIPADAAWLAPVLRLFRHCQFEAWQWKDDFRPYSDVERTVGLEANESAMRLYGMAWYD